MKEIEFDYSKLRGKIKELGITLKDFAKIIGITPASLYYRLKNQRYFGQDEIVKTMNLFNEPIDNSKYYFFKLKVTKNETDN